ncbi:MAG: HIT domain-containing protein [Alphaproteobacteria bacterium]
MYNENNIFNKIINGQAHCDKIYEDEKILAFKDAYPRAPIHVLVIPKGEFTSFVDFISNNTQEEIGYFFKKVKEIAEQLGVEEGGYRLVTNHGKNANQVVPHFHVHILGGKIFTSDS